MPSEPTWIEAEAAIQLNAIAVAQTGEPHGLRDVGLLEGALASPKNSFFYGEVFDLATLAAILMMAVARVHPILQGNKRTGAAIGGAFLEINSYHLSVDGNDFADLFLAVLERRQNMEEFADAIDRNLVPVQDP